MKKRYIVLLVLVAVVVAGGLFLYSQRNNVKALYYLQTMKVETLQEEMDRNSLELKQALKDNGMAEITVSDEDLQMVMDGEWSVEEAAQKIVGGDAGEQTHPDTGKPSGMDSPQPSAVGENPASNPPVADNGEAIQTQVATMYVLKATFVARLEAIVQEAKDAYTALPAERRTSQEKVGIVYGKTAQLSALERECDEKVAAVVAEVRRLLRESGGDNALADKLEQVYEQEKSLKKAYYIKELNG